MTPPPWNFSENSSDLVQPSFPKNKILIGWESATCLLQSIEERLETSKMTNQLVDPQDSHYLESERT